MSGTIGLSFIIYGVAIVISIAVAALIKGIVVALPLAERRARRAAAAAAPATEEVPPEHVAAIGAALAATLGAHHIVHSEDRGRGVAWTAEGRMLHQTSHAVSRSPKR